MSSLLELNRSPSPSPLRIGGILLAVTAEPDVRLRIIHPLYRAFIERAAPKNESLKINVHMALGPVPALEGMEKIFTTGESWSLFRDQARYWIALHPPRHAKPFWAARFDRRVQRVDFFQESPAPTKGKKYREIAHPVCYPLDQLLLMYFFAARKGILLHAAGLVYRGKAFLFTGASGAGKSTISQLLAAGKAGKLLSDERMIVREMAGTMQAFGTPWAGTAGIARAGSAPLSGIFFLKHGMDNRIGKLDASAAADRLLPLASIPWYDPDATAPIIAFAKRLTTEIPAFEMSFKPDRTAVDLLLSFLKEYS